MAKVNDKIISNLDLLSHYNPLIHCNPEAATPEVIRLLMKHSGDLLSGCSEYFSEHFKELKEKESRKVK